MSDYLAGKTAPHKGDKDLFGLYGSSDPQPIQFSKEAQSVLDAGRELWRYFHAQPDVDVNAALYDIKAYFQGCKTTATGKQMMNTTSTDEQYSQLMTTLREALHTLARTIEPKVYAYGFLKH